VLRRISYWLRPDALFRKASMQRPRTFATFLSWAVLLLLIVGPIVVAAFSPLLKSRELIYVIGGLSGVVALSLLLVQPLLAIGYLTSVSLIKQRRWHQWSGTLLVVSIALHIAALYITSPDDITDALLLRSATPFSVYGVIALWGVLLIAMLVAFRSKIKIPIKRWKTIHAIIAAISVVASIIHALWIQGAMGAVSKWVLCGTIVFATGYAVHQLDTLQAIFRKRRN
jgi:predicted ferric reductase